MNALRSGNEQINEELARMHYEMTDPVMQERAEMKKQRVERITNRKKNYGL